VSTEPPSTITWSVQLCALNDITKSAQATARELGYARSVLT